MRRASSRGSEHVALSHLLGRLGSVEGILVCAVNWSHVLIRIGLQQELKTAFTDATSGLWCRSG